MAERSYRKTIFSASGRCAFLGTGVWLLSKGRAITYGKGGSGIGTEEKELTLDEAKANFKAAVMELDPVRIIRKKPLHVLGAMAFAGLLMGFTGKGVPAFLSGAKPDLRNN